MWLFSVVIFLMAGVCRAAPTTAAPEQEEPTELPSLNTSLSEEDVFKAKEYLSAFFSEVGVTAPNSTWRSALDSFEETLKKMQEFFGLEVSGQLDTNTLQVMELPRCGFNDVTRYSHFDGQPRWDKPVVTYRITKYTPDLSRREVDDTIAKALRVYSDVIPLDFKQIYAGTADIMILFQAQDHGDFAPFDGPNGVLAHAFSPGEGRGGDAHFDEDENWSITAPEANLFLVAAHELGHALGLAHSQDQTALMFPTYQYVNTEGYKLPSDDRKGIQAIYGVRDSRPQPTSLPTLGPAVDRCSPTLSFDAITPIRSRLYFFKDNYVWRRSSGWDGVSRKRIGSVWSGIKRVDAAYQYDSYVFFFEGNRYWKMIGKAILPGYPKPLSDLGFPAYVTKVDAAVHVSFVGKTLFFVKNRFWSYSERRGRMDLGFPKFIFIDLPGIGFRVDAAFEFRGYLYFSSGSRQTEYDYPRRRAIRSIPNYKWMDCY
ncbi:macrophage metalloelastase-like [Synchiropus picturatus]